MELWIPFTLLAASMQVLRTALQKRLTGSLSTMGSAASRFMVAAPLASLLALGWLTLTAQPIPSVNQAFFAYALAGGAAQIGATALLMRLFAFRNFAVGVTLTKTEAIQAAVLGLFILGDAVSLPVMIAIGISSLGVILLVLPANGAKGASLEWRSTLLGLASGAFFGVSFVAYRGASLSLDGGDFLARSLTTLAIITAIQSTCLAVWLKLREPGQLSAMVQQWRMLGLVGAVGVLASIGWFTAITLQSVGEVKVIGQVEIVITVLFSHFMFRERLKPREMGGIALIGGGILVLLIQAP